MWVIPLECGAGEGRHSAATATSSPGAIVLDHAVSEPSTVHVEMRQLLCVQIEAKRRGARWGG